MSCSDPLKPRHSGSSPALVLLCLGLVLSGCGFQPLYARGDNGLAVTDQLAATRVQPIQDRVGQQLHNLLRDRLNPLGQPAKPRYRLTIALTERTQSLSIRRDATATRANLTMTVVFTLTDYTGGDVLYRGNAVSINSYDILELEQQFSTMTSEGDARTRALQDISEDVRLRLAGYFSRAGG